MESRLVFASGVFALASNSKAHQGAHRLRFPLALRLRPRAQVLNALWVSLAVRGGSGPASCTWLSSPPQAMYEAPALPRCVAGLSQAETHADARLFWAPCCSVVHVSLCLEASTTLF